MRPKVQKQVPTFVSRYEAQRSQTGIQIETLESVDSQGSVAISPSKLRRHSAHLPDFFRRVSISQIGRRLSVRNARRKSKTFSQELSCTGSNSQPHLHQTTRRTFYSPPTGLERTKSVSGTFFRRTQRKFLRFLFSFELFSCPGLASRAGSRRFQEAQSMLLSMKGRIADTMSFGSTENQTDSSSRRVSRDLTFRLLELEE